MCSRSWSWISWIELQEFHNDYPLAPDKADIKKEMLAEYQLKIPDLYSISIANVKKLVPNIFDKKKVRPKTRIETKKKTSRIRI